MCSWRGLNLLAGLDPETERDANGGGGRCHGGHASSKSMRSDGEQNRKRNCEKKQDRFFGGGGDIAQRNGLGHGYRIVFSRLYGYRTKSFTEE